jgi:hypothetical protein
VWQRPLLSLLTQSESRHSRIDSPDACDTILPKLHCKCADQSAATQRGLPGCNQHTIRPEVASQPLEIAGHAECLVRCNDAVRTALIDALVTLDGPKNNRTADTVNGLPECQRDRQLRTDWKFAAELRPGNVVACGTTDDLNIPRPPSLIADEYRVRPACWLALR